jgi:hypothetical protein
MLHHPAEEISSNSNVKRAGSAGHDIGAVTPFLHLRNVSDFDGSEHILEWHFLNESNLLPSSSAAVILSEPPQARS